MDFEEALRDLGFVLERQTRAVRHYASRPTRFLTYWIQAYPDGTALFTWEFAIAEWAAARGLQVGSDEHLNTFLYPQADDRGPQDAAWLAERLDRTESVLRSLSFFDGE